MMSIDLSALHALPVTEKMQLVEMLWDDLGRSSDPIPLPDWVDQEAVRRRNEMRDPSFGLTHVETWLRIANRNG